MKLRRSAWTKFTNGIRRGSLARTMDESSLPYGLPFLTFPWPAKEAGDSVLMEAVYNAGSAILPGVGATLCFSHAWDTVELQGAEREKYRIASQRKTVLNTAYSLLAPVSTALSPALAVFPVLPLRVYVALKADPYIPILPRDHFTDIATCRLLYDVWLYNELTAQIIYALSGRMAKG